MISFEIHLEKWHEKTQKPLWFLGFPHRYLFRFAMMAYTAQFDTMQRYWMARCTPRLSQNGLQIRFRSSNRCNVKLLHQEVQDIGGYESRQCGAKADVLDA